MLFAFNYYQRSQRRPRPLVWGIRDAVVVRNSVMDCHGSVVVPQRQIWIPSSSHWNNTTTQCATTYPPPPPNGLLPVTPQQQQQQQQQKRYVGKGLPHIRRQAKRYGYTNDDAKLQICHSDYDLLLDTELEDAFHVDSEDMTFAKVKFNLSDIKQAVEEIYEDSRRLQYYDRAERKWHALTDLETLPMYRGGKRVLQVRVPEYYDDTPMVMRNEPYSDDDDYDLDFDPNDENEVFRPKTKKKGLVAPHHPPDRVAMYLEDSIKSLVVQLKESGHVRADGVIYGDQGHRETMYAVRHSETQVKQWTRDYVLTQVTTTTRYRLLARLFVAVPGALDHVVRGIHEYSDRLWGPRYVPRRPRYRTRYRPNHTTTTGTYIRYP
jgi:hypothetical protein